MSGSDPVFDNTNQPPEELHPATLAAMHRLVELGVASHNTSRVIALVSRRLANLHTAQHNLRFEADETLTSAFNANTARLDAELRSQKTLLAQHRLELLVQQTQVGPAGMKLLQLMLAPKLEEGRSGRCPSCKLLLEQGDNHLAECVWLGKANRSL